MFKKKLLATLLCSTALLSAQNIVNFAVGPSWPQADMVKENDPKAVWTCTAEWGKVFDKRIIVGAKADFSWHIVKEMGKWDIDSAKTVESNDINKKTRSFMLPLSVWIGVDPVPQYRFHPVVHAQVGYNSLFYGETNYDVGKPKLPDNVFKYYNGFFAKFGLDGMFDLGKSASIFGGFEYQIAPLYHKKNNKLEQISFNAPMVRLGVSFLY